MDDSFDPTQLIHSDTKFLAESCHFAYPSIFIQLQTPQFFLFLWDTLCTLITQNLCSPHPHYFSLHSWKQCREGVMDPQCTDRAAVPWDTAATLWPLLDTHHSVPGEHPPASLPLKAIQALHSKEGLQCELRCPGDPLQLHVSKLNSPVPAPIRLSNF